MKKPYICRHSRGRDGIRPPPSGISDSRKGESLARILSSVWVTLLVALLPSCALVLLFFPGHYALISPFCYLLNSLIVIPIYKLDKWLAVRSRDDLWRIPEAILHLWAFLGGWPGALYARRHYRHKTQKLSFRIVFWLTVLLNLSVTLFSFFPILPLKLIGFFRGSPAGL